MIGFLKYIKGYLRIRVWGFSPERFMNLCSNKGILLWDIVKTGEMYEMCIHVSGFKSLRPIVKKTGTRVAILGRYGLLFFVPEIWKRKVFVAGLFLAAAFWILSSRYVWRIELNGNYQITEDVFNGFLEEQNVKIGMERDDLNIAVLEKEIRRRFPQIIWASAKLTGTRLSIDIKENDTPLIAEEKEDGAGTDLVSEYGGRIVSMIVRSGTPVVSIGDTVETGAVLVEGKIPIYNDDQTVREYRYVEADADIVLEYGVSFQATLPFDYIKNVYTGREKQSRYLRIGENRLRLPQEEPFLTYDCLIRERMPVIFRNLSIPVSFGTCQYREYLKVEFQYTKEEAEAALKEKLISFLSGLKEKGVQMIENNVKIETSGETWILKGEFLVQGPVGKSAATARTESGETQENEQ